MSPSKVVLVAASTRRGTRPLSPSALFFLDEHQLDRHLLQRVAEPGGIGSGCQELHVALLFPPPGSCLGEHLERPLLGHRADAHDDPAIDLPAVGSLDHRHLLAHQLEEDLVLLQRGQESQAKRLAQPTFIRGGFVDDDDDDGDDGSYGPSSAAGTTPTPSRRR